MDSLILALEEHKSKSKPWPVTSITRIIHLRERRELMEGGERETERDPLSLFLLLLRRQTLTPTTYPPV